MSNSTVTALNLEFSVYAQFNMSFEGEVEPEGALGYRFSGTLTVTDTRDVGREATNIARLWHGGKSKSWSHLDSAFLQKTTRASYERSSDGSQAIDENDDSPKELTPFELYKLDDFIRSPKKFEIEGQGTRSANEPVEFCIGYNAFDNGFLDGQKKQLTLSGPDQTINPRYQYVGPFGEVTEVCVERGTARADGPNGFTIECGFSVRAPKSAGALSVTFGYKTSSGSWKYETFANDYIIPRLKISGTRKPGEHIQLIVGLSDGVFGTYSYGDEFDCALPEEF